MAEYLVFADSDDATIVKGGTIDDVGPNSDPSLQVHAPGQTAYLVPQGTLAWPGINLEPMRAAMTAKVDTAAEAFRLNFITPGAGQAMTYAYKASEVKAWEADNTVPTPFLTAEATARGMTVADLAAEAGAQITAWITIGSKIEGARMGAKAAITAATTVPAMARAGNVDWAALASS